MPAHLKSCYSSCSRIAIGMQLHTDFGLPGCLMLITALARGVPTGHLQPHFWALTGWPLTVPFGCLPFLGDAVGASGWLPAALSSDTALNPWMSQLPSPPSLSLPSPSRLPGVAWAWAAWALASPPPNTRSVALERSTSHFSTV